MDFKENTLRYTLAVCLLCPHLSLVISVLLKVLLYFSFFLFTGIQ